MVDVYSEYQIYFRAKIEGHILGWSINVVRPFRLRHVNKCFIGGNVHTKLVEMNISLWYTYCLFNFNDLTVHSAH